MTLKNFILLILVLLFIGAALRVYEQYRGKPLKFFNSNWYQGCGIIVGLILMGLWSGLVQDGSVHEFSEDIAEIIVKYIQKAARILGLR